jgi:transmembrane sensor
MSFHFFKYRHHTPADDDVRAAIDHSLTEQAKQLASIDPQTEKQWRQLQTILNTKQHPTEEKQVFHKFLKPSIAFAIILAAITGSVILFHPFLKTYSTAKAQHESITLADSTEVILNHTSELTVKHSLFEKARRVSLTGEAFFHVHKNGTPFIISTAAGTVQVLGTQFNIRVRENKMEVSVLNGCVKITSAKNGTDSSIVLTHDQIAICAANDFPEQVKEYPFSSHPGWIVGQLTFYHANITDVCKELEEQFDVVISVHHPNLYHKTITGILDGKSIESALTALAQLTGASYRYESGCYHIE